MRGWDKGYIRCLSERGKIWFILPNVYVNWTVQIGCYKKPTVKEIKNAIKDF